MTFVFVKQGLIIKLWSSKTDQEAVSREVCILPGKRADTCPVSLLREWIRQRAKSAGPLFCRITPGDAVTMNRLSGESVNKLVKRGLELIGVDPKEYGAHSLRAGLVTAAADGGANPMVIMKRTGHKRLETVQRYYRSAEQFAADPLAKAL